MEKQVHEAHAQAGDSPGVNHQAYLSSSTSSFLLVPSWSTATHTGLLLAVFAGVMASLSLEGLKCFCLTHKMALFLFKAPSSRFSRLQRLLTSLLHIVDVCLAYFLMLLIMSFNIYIITAVIIGAGLGHFVLRPVLFHRITARLQRRSRVMRILSPQPCQFQMQKKEETDDDDDKVLNDCGGEDSGDQVRTSEPKDPMLLCRQYKVNGKETGV